MVRLGVRFINCTVRNAANNRNYSGAWAPIWLHVAQRAQAARFGGIDFVDCLVEDDCDRPAVVVEETESNLGIFDITGTIAVINPFGVNSALGDKQHDVTLAVTESGP